MSSDGRRHEGEMSAPDKDSVYAALRERGIRAIKVNERIAPVVRKGFSGLRKRDWTIIVAVLAVIIGVAFAVMIRSPKLREVEQFEKPQGPSSLAPATHGAVLGSPAVQIAQPRPRRFLELPAGLDLASVFKYPHEIYLAGYTRPGVKPAAALSLTPEIVQDFYDNLSASVVISEDDAPEIAELKRIVAGMKDDARKYISVPDGIVKLDAWLVERQDMEETYRNQFVQRVKAGNLTMDEANEVFQAMGLEKIGEKNLR